MTLSELVVARLKGVSSRWPPSVDEPFAVAFSSATKRVGKAALVLKPEEVVALGSLAGWCLDDAARVSLLVDQAQRLSDAQMVALAEETFRQGDSRERAAILRALPLLPGPSGFVPLAVEACRASVQPVFEAIACENPFPAAHFPELNFNQLVLKALFIEVSVVRIFGLEQRLNAELSRMAADYAKERSAAGRSVPADIARLTR